MGGFISFFMTREDYAFIISAPLCERIAKKKRERKKHIALFCVSLYRPWLVTFSPSPFCSF